MSCSLRGIGAREPDAYELRIGWLLMDGGALQRVEHGEPDADDPATAGTELEALMDAAAVRSEQWAVGIGDQVRDSGNSF